MGETRLKGPDATTVASGGQQHGAVGDCRVDGNIAKIASSGKVASPEDLVRTWDNVQAEAWPSSIPA